MRRRGRYCGSRVRTPAALLGTLGRRVSQRLGERRGYSAAAQDRREKRKTDQSTVTHEPPPVGRAGIVRRLWSRAARRESTKSGGSGGTLLRGAVHRGQLLICAWKSKVPIWYTGRHERDNVPPATGLARRAPAAGVGTASGRLVGQGDRRSVGRESRRREPMAQARAGGRRRSVAAHARARPEPPLDGRATSPPADAVGSWSRHLWLFPEDTSPAVHAAGRGSSVTS